MSFKNVIQENRIKQSLYQLNIQPGIGVVTLTSVGELESEMDSTDLPDGTMRSGGRTKPFEFEIVQPAHHDLEVAAMEAWWAECQHPVSPTHLKLATYTRFDTLGLPRRNLILPNCWLKKRVESESTMEDEGTMAMITWTIACDDII